MAALSASTLLKLSLLQLAHELGNVSKACRLMGYHRDTFYEVRRAFQVGGVPAVLVKKSICLSRLNFPHRLHHLIRYSLGSGVMPHAGSPDDSRDRSLDLLAHPLDRFRRRRA